jgi:hypothetical protein
MAEGKVLGSPFAGVRGGGVCCAGADDIAVTIASAMKTAIGARER